MSFFHGIRTSEVATSIGAPSETAAGLIVAFGTSPIHLAKNPAEANKPVLCYTYEEFVSQFGYSDDFDKYTLCEVAKSQFVLFSMSPIAFVNVLDINKHFTEKTIQAQGIINTPAIIKAPVISVQVKTKKIVDEEETIISLTENEDYKVENDGESATITILDASKVENDTVTIIYREVDASKVTSADIIGGINPTTKANEGLECVEDIYPKFRMPPGILISPKFSCNPEVAAVMKAKTQNINECFKCIAIVDIPTDTVKDYTQAGEYKNTNNLADPNLIVCYPKVSLGGVQYHLSTQMASLCNQVDAANDDLPFESPSNKNLQCDSSVLKDGTEKFFGLGQANLLNASGITTALNFSNGWVLWGNLTSSLTSDVKDKFIPVRRFFNWFANNLILSYFEKVDSPTNRRLIDYFVNTINIYINGLVARGALLTGSRIEFLSNKNPTTDLLSGKIKFHIYLTPAIPAQEINFVLEFDANNLQNLFS